MSTTKIKLNLQYDIEMDPVNCLQPHKRCINGVEINNLFIF